MTLLFSEQASYSASSLSVNIEHIQNKMNRVAVWLVCLALVVCAMARRGGGGFKGGFSFGKGSSTGSKGTGTGTRGSKPKGSSTGGSHTQQANYPRQPQVPNQNPPPYPGTGGGHAGSFPGRGGTGSNPGQGGYPGQGRIPDQGSYPRAGSNPNSYPGRGGAFPYPQGGSYPGYPVRGASYPGSNPNPYGGAGGYPGAAQYPYWNPNNKIISPRYGGNYGQGGYGSYGAGGSPFAQSVHNMGMGPSLQSKGFGKQALMAAGVGAMAGMAVGYGLGSFPRPHFSFHNPQEEYYYNHYMSRRYGTRPDSNRDPSSPDIGPGDSGSSPTNIFQNLPPNSFKKYMDSCMDRTDLLRESQGRNKRAAEDSWPQEVEDSEKGLTEDDPNEPLDGKPVGEAESQGSDIITGNENTGEGNKTSNATDNPLPFAERLTGGTEPPTEPQEKMNEEEEDDATASILEIGYPALIEQLKARRCLELYVVYAEHHAEKQVRVGIDNSGGKHLMPLGLMVISLLMNSLLFY
ncbi:hypothetical protein AMELA_G00161480 [Ameiurus melas]|uniref:Prion protein n=1 Tax=Ameiurus melas TaxID=219545 RepID=A0A7J6AHY1_AMEME|nr:hypothetical protein AMELA_G00161480 [Ameiurus melas]